MSSAPQEPDRARRRLVAMLRKEFLQIVRDPSSIVIALVLPLILLLLFGYGVTLDAKDVPIAVVVEQPSAETASFAAGLAGSPYFAPQSFAAIQQAEPALLDGRVQAIVWLRGEFARLALSSREAPIGLIVSGIDANTARILEGYVEGVYSTWLEQYAAANGRPLSAPIVAAQRVWFNPEVRSRNFLVPGLIAIIMTLIGALLTAMVVSREWERGTMEALLVTPVTVREILLGKLIPYFTLGMGGLGLSVLMAVFLFEVRLRGSLWLLFATSALFLLVALGMGLLISTAARNQFVAGQLAIITTYLPAFLLSGFIFFIGSMPQPIQWLTYVIGARYYVTILQTLFLAGDLWRVILLNAAALVLMASVLLALVRRRTRKSLE